MRMGEGLDDGPILILDAGVARIGDEGVSANGDQGQFSLLVHEVFLGFGWEGVP